MRKFGGSEEAVSPVIGVVLMVGLTVVMISAIAVSVLAFTLPENAPQAKIVARETEGGLASAGTAFKNNTIQLAHKGGNSLDVKNTKIIITGIGQSHTPCPNPCPYVPAASPYIGNIRITYFNLTKHGKDSIYYNTHNKLILQDGFWTAGENLLLSGEDSKSGNDDESSVWVSVDGDGNTSNNYGFKVREKIYITVMDTITDQVISTTFATVKPIN